MPRSEHIKKTKEAGPFLESLKMKSAKTLFSVAKPRAHENASSHFPYHCRASRDRWKPIGTGSARRNANFRRLWPGRGTPEQRHDDLANAATMQRCRIQDYGGSVVVFLRAYQSGVAIRRLRIGKSRVSISKTRSVVFESTSSRMMTVHKNVGCECIIRMGVFKSAAHHRH